MSEIDPKHMQCFYASKEQSHCPIITKILKIGKQLQKLSDISQNSQEIYASMLYGKRVIINTPPASITKAAVKDFIEIIDFDPVKNTMLLIGQKQPRWTTAIHWYIHKTLKGNRCLIEISDKKKEQIWKETFPVIKKESSSINMIKNILPFMKNNQIIFLDTVSVFIWLNDINEVEKIILPLYEV